MHAQTQAPPAQANEAVSARAALALAAACGRPDRLDAQIADIEAFTRDVVRPAQFAHNAAEEAEIAAQARASSDAATAVDTQALERAREEEAKTDAVWVAAYEQRDLMISEMLDVRVSSAEDALRKADAAIRLSSDGKFTLATTNDYNLLKEVAEALARDIAALTAPTPTPDRAAWDAAIATRARLRNQAQEYERRVGADIPADQNAALIDAEFAAYATPAPDFTAVLWKLADNMLADWGDLGDTIEDVLAKCDSSGDLAEVVTASIYRDIQRLASPVAHSVSSPLPSSAEPADRELIKIGAEIESLRAELDRANDTVIALHVTTWADGEFEYGPGEDHAAVTARRIARETETGLTTAIDVTNDLCERIWTLANRAIELPASTLAGFRAKALAADWARPTDRSLVALDEDWLDLPYALIDQLVAVAGQLADAPALLIAAE